MITDMILQDKVLTGAIAIIALIWGYVLFRNIHYGKKTHDTFATEYNKIINADEYKVKGRFEE